MALCIIFVSALALLTNAAHPRQMDFISFWAAGKLSLAANPLAAYDIVAHKQAQMTIGQFDALMPFPYPPPFLLVVTPLALLPYGISAIAWVFGTWALYVAAARRAFPLAGRLPTAFPPVLVNGIIGQNGLLTGAVFIGGMNLIGRSPLRAGLLLGCLIIKPHLAMLLPLAFAAGGYWRTFVGAAVSTLGLLLAALVVFGAESYHVAASMVPLYTSVASEGLVGWHKMASVLASLQLAGVSPAIAWSGHIFIGCAAAVAVWVAWRSDAELSAKASVLATASVLISPYIFLHDTTVLLLPFLWLMRNGEDRRILAVLWCVPLVVLLQSWGLNTIVNPAPLLPIALLVLIWRRMPLHKLAHNEADVTVTSREK